MVEVTTKYFCDRCGKETNIPWYPKSLLYIRQIERNIFKWDCGNYETVQLCKACADSFDERWKGK